MTGETKLRMRFLENKSVLVTRPKEQADSLAASLIERGAKVIKAPMIEISAAPNVDSAFIGKVLKMADIVIFVSFNAVKHGLQNSPQIIQLLESKKIFSIGASTAQALRKLGFTYVLFPEKNSSSEGLLELDGMNPCSVKFKNIVIFKGADGRRKLEITLERRGAVITIIECYKRIESSLSLKELFGFSDIIVPSVAVFTSGSIVDSLARKIREEGLSNLYDMPVVVVSKRLEKIARDLGFRGEIIFAENASNQAILGALENWVRRD